MTGNPNLRLDLHCKYNHFDDQNFPVAQVEDYRHFLFWITSLFISDMDRALPPVHAVTEELEVDKLAAQ